MFLQQNAAETMCPGYSDASLAHAHYSQNSMIVACTGTSYMYEGGRTHRDAHPQAEHVHCCTLQSDQNLDFYPSRSRGWLVRPRGKTAAPSKF